MSDFQLNKTVIVEAWLLSVQSINGKIPQMKVQPAMVIQIQMWSGTWRYIQSKVNQYTIKSKSVYNQK